jgi:hydrogenase/urease accessory protein HupE
MLALETVSQSFGHTMVYAGHKTLASCVHHPFSGRGNISLINLAALPRATAECIRGLRAHISVATAFVAVMNRGSYVQFHCPTTS